MDFELKRWKEKYLSALKSFAADKDSCDIPHGLPRSGQEAEKYIRARLLADEERELCRAVIVDGQPVGLVEITRGSGMTRHTASVRFWLAEEYRRRGIMSSALARLCEQAFERLDIVRIDAEVPFGEVAARKALNNAGFSLEGTLARRAFVDGRYEDMCIYALLN